MDRLTEVKKLVRSILIPQKNGYSISQLSEDYVELEGSAIPFQNFGHSSLVEFLKSIDDTVKFFADRLYPVSSETTAHIEKMVQEQRDGGPGRKPKRQSIPHQPLNSKREDPNRVFQSHAPRSREQVPRKYISSSPTRHKSQESLVRGLSRRSPQTYDEAYCGAKARSQEQHSTSEFSPVRNSWFSQQITNIKRDLSRRRDLSNSPSGRSPSWSPKRSPCRSTERKRNGRYAPRHSRSRSRSRSPGLNLERRRSRHSRSRERHKDRPHKKSHDKSPQPPEKVSKSVQVEVDELGENGSPTPSKSPDFSVAAFEKMTFFSVPNNETSSPLNSLPIEPCPQASIPDAFCPLSQARIERPSGMVPDSKWSAPETICPNDSCIRDPRLRKRLEQSQKVIPQQVTIIAQTSTQPAVFDFPEYTSPLFEPALKDLLKNFASNPERCYLYYIHAYGWGWHLEGYALPENFAPICKEDHFVLHPWFEEDRDQPGKYYDFNRGDYVDIPKIPFTFSRFLQEYYLTNNPFDPATVSASRSTDNTMPPHTSTTRSITPSTSAKKSVKKLSLTDYRSQKSKVPYSRRSDQPGGEINNNSSSPAPTILTIPNNSLNTRDPRLRRVT